LLPFRSLDPFRALREPDRRRRDEKRPFPLRTKNRQRNPKQPLDRKSPIQVSCELVSENAKFPASRVKYREFHRFGLRQRLRGSEKGHEINRLWVNSLRIL